MCSRMDQVEFVEDSIQNISSDVVCLKRPYHFQYSKGCLPQILPCPFLNTLSRITMLAIYCYLERAITKPSFK